MTYKVLMGILLLAGTVVAPPPRGHGQAPAQPTEEQMDMNSETLGLEYRNYLEEVVKTLEQDEQFKIILQNATDEEIKSGKVADQLHVVDPQLRSKLDELKRIELQRLRQRATEAFELSNGLDRDAVKEPLHLEHRNPHTFREDDLRKLIHKTTKDLEELDQQRREEFKKYEMEKEFKYQEEIKGMDEVHKKEAQKKHEEELQKKKQHPQGESQVHHPLSEDQLEEVWEEQDHMDKQDFDPVTFFRMHDLDGNEVLDQAEVMALFKHELDKIYNGTDYDPHEREEEMNEMREATYNEVDTDRDGFISLKEFIASTQHDDYQRDQGWESIGEREQYQQREYEEYERQRMAEIQRQINMGMMAPPHQGYQLPPGYAGQPGVGQPPPMPQGFIPPHAAGLPPQQQQQQQPVMVDHQGNVMQQHPAASLQPGLVQQQPGMVQQQPGMVQQQPGMVQQQPGMVHPAAIQQQAGMVQQQPGMVQQPGMAAQHQQAAQLQQQIHQQMQQQQIPVQQVPVQQVPMQQVPQQQQVPVQQQKQQAQAAPINQVPIQTKA